MNPPLPQDAGRRRLANRALVAVGLALVVVHGGLLAAGAYADADVPPSVDLQLRLDPNRATAAELMLLPGIGPKTAERITAYRDTCPQVPPFRCAADLDHVYGIGPATVARLRPLLRFDHPEPLSATAEN